jgi:tRNA(Ile)-lysidine synthase
MSRGSGVTGLSGMTPVSPLPVRGAGEIRLVRPLLDLPKARLIATVAAAGLDFADDPSNRDPRFTRARIRASMPALASEGLTAARLSRLAQRVQRAEAALEAATDAAWTALAQERSDRAGITFGSGFSAMPAELQLRLLGRAIASVGNEGPVELGKLEALHGALAQPQCRLRRTLAGAMVTRMGERLTVERAPARRKAPSQPHRNPLNHRATLPPQSGQTAIE